MSSESERVHVCVSICVLQVLCNQTYSEDRWVIIRQATDKKAEVHLSRVQILPPWSWLGTLIRY